MNFIKRFAGWMFLLLWLASPAWATTVSYQSSHLGGTQWRYDYTVLNDTLAAPIDEFSVFFAPGLYANLQDASSAPGWDVLMIQPDPAIPGDGYLDALALAAGIAPGAAAGGFAVVFDYFGAGAPPAQAFTVWDPLTFAVIDSGVVTAAAVLPLASTAWLLLAGLLPLAWRYRKTGCTLLLAGALAACGADRDEQPSAQVSKLQASTIVSGSTAAAASQFEVIALEKTGEQRVDRSTYDYTYRVSIRNNGSESASNINATLTAAPAGTTIVSGTVTAAAIGAGASVTADGQIVLRIDRTIAFTPDALAWNITADSAIALEEARPAEVYVLPLADLGFPQGADSVSASGAISEALLKDGTLRFATPGDTGVNQYAQFLISQGGVATKFSLLIRTQLPTDVEVFSDDPDAGAPPLTISGLGPHNTLQAGSLSFRLPGAAGLDLQDDSGGLVLGPNNFALSLKPYWTYNGADGSFTISAAAMGQLLASLPNGRLDISLNYVSKDGGFAQVYNLIALKAGATLNGKLVNSLGAAVTGLAGRKVLLRGYNSQLRRDATVDASGNFSFGSVIPDTYQVTLSDLATPNVVSVSAPVFAGSTAVNVTLTYTGASTSKLAAATAVISGLVTQDGAGPPARQLATAPSGAKAAAAVSAAAAGTTYTATAAAQNQTVTTPINFSVPKGTSSVGVTITVQTAEYPVYTTAQSQYNDTWSYSVTGLPGTVLSASGAVNQSHFTQGTITSTSCIDVASQAKDAAFSVGGAVSATNIGDALLATVTSVELSLDCVELSVTAAKFTSPNQAAHPVVKPISTAANLAGVYLSVGNSDSTHTVPLEVQYAPADATITEVNLSISPSGANPAFASANLLSQTNTKTPGKIRFPALTLPTFASAMGTGKVAVTVRIKGTVEGTEATSDPAKGGAVAFGGETAYTPLALAGNEAGLSGRRTNGLRDAGGDSWATRQTVSWLQAKPYRFDDISGQHVTQTASGRSILGHSGHSDGQQLDLRYADGQGGYTDGLGGQSSGADIKSLIDAAAAEVAANAAQKPKLAALVAWINANRTTLGNEAGAAATRVIYIGPDFIKLALVDGKFSSAANAQIPGVSAWSLPARVQVSTIDHLSHWHISLNAHP